MSRGGGDDEETRRRESNEAVLRRLGLVGRNTRTARSRRETDVLPFRRPSDEVEDRLTRIRASIDRINNLMADIRERTNIDENE